MNQVLQPYYEKSVSCPHCEDTFQTRRIRSRFSNPIHIDSDFCPHYKADTHNPLFYYVHVCPQCGYSFSEQFNPHFPPSTKERIWENVSRAWQRLDFGGKRDINQAIHTYKLAILCGDLKKEKHEVMAGLCLRLAWMYRYAGNKEQEERFIRLAINKYELAYLENSHFEEAMSEMKVLYLIGELYRRLEQPKEAITYFSKVLEHKNKSVELKMVKMAREQWMLMREQKRTEEEVPQ